MVGSIRAGSGFPGDHRENRHLNAVHEAGGHQRPVHRQAAVRAQRHVGLLLEPGRCFSRDTHGSRASRSTISAFSISVFRAERGGAEDHPLFLGVQGEAVPEEFGALLVPVAAPMEGTPRPSPWLRKGPAPIDTGPENPPLGHE